MPSLLVSAVGHLFDDAGVFPPARLPMAEALAAHARATSGPYSRLVGPFLCPVSRLDELDACVASGLPRPRQLGVIAYDVGRSGRRLGATPGLVQIEAPLGTPLPDLGGRVRRYFEVSWRTPMADQLDAVLAAGARVKVRCGGPTRDDVPSCHRLADAVIGCAARGLALKATAGLHQPFRYRGRDGPHHGFVNLLAAAAAARVGGGHHDVVAILACEEPQAAGLVEVVARARDLLASIGTSSIDEPVQALVTRGLL